ncbi:GTP binding protein [Paramecium bursaria]
MLIILLSFSIALEVFEEQIQSQRLKLCDRVVGTYFDQNIDDIRKYTQSYSNSTQALHNYFYYMITNCYSKLAQTNPDSTIDPEILNQYDWLQIIKPIHNQGQRDISYLNEEEQFIQTIMREEKLKIQQQIDDQEYKIVKILSQIGINTNIISIVAIIIIMSVFFICLCYSLGFLIREQLKEDKRQQQLRMKKNN